MKAEPSLINPDVKSANVLLSDVDTDSPIVKIADLGLGKHP